MVNQPDILVVNKKDKKAVLVDVTRNTRAREIPEVERGAGKDVGSKGFICTSEDRSTGAVTPKLGELLQQIQGITSEISVRKSTILGIALRYRVWGTQ